jgi:hypothetical protein
MIICVAVYAGKYEVKDLVTCCYEVVVEGDVVVIGVVVGRRW